jgi:hypothetical protein
MPLTLLDLDDRSYADLVTEARALIPALAPDWTDHNPADPGITLIELFAWLTEMLLYRIDQVTDSSRLAFLRLINGRDWKQTKSIAEEIRNTVVDLRKPTRAVTAADFEQIALGIPGLARAYCVPRRNLELGSHVERDGDRQEHVSLVVVPAVNPEPTAHVLDAMLDRARLLTTRVHVVAARPFAIGFDLTVRDPAHSAGGDWRRAPPLAAAAITLQLMIHARPETGGDRLLAEAEGGLRCFFDPREGGFNGRGWPFGRAVYLSEVYQCLARLPGADYVATTEGKAQVAVTDPGEKWRYAEGELEAIRLEPDEFPQAVFATGEKITLIPEEPARQRP